MSATIDGCQRQFQIPIIIDFKFDVTISSVNAMGETDSVRGENLHLKKNSI